MAKISKQTLFLSVILILTLLIASAALVLGIRQAVLLRSKPWKTTDAAGIGLSPLLDCPAQTATLFVDVHDHDIRYEISDPVFWEKFRSLLTVASFTETEKYVLPADSPGSGIMTSLKVTVDGIKYTLMFRDDVLNIRIENQPEKNYLCSHGYSLRTLISDTYRSFDRQSDNH